jgi:hypothetical protein
MEKENKMNDQEKLLKIIQVVKELSPVIRDYLDRGFEGSAAGVGVVALEKIQNILEG